MDALEMDQVARKVDALVAALEDERFRHVAGLDADPTLVGHFAARHEAAHRDTATRLREAGHEPLARVVAVLRAERVAAEHEERWRAADARAVAVGPRGPEPLAALELAVVRERDPDRRARLARAAADAMGAAASAREAWAETRARAAAEVGLSPDWGAVVEGDEVLSASDDGYRDVLAFSTRRALGAAAGGAGRSRADLLYALEAPRWDGLFRPGMLPVALRLTLEKLGLDPGRLRVDEAERPAKWPGAHAVGARISWRPRRGVGDWADLLAAAGRALAASSARPSARDPVLAEALAWLLGSLLLEPRWLAERADVERRFVRDVRRDLALRRLFALRADSAALRVACEVERGLAGAAWRDAHRDALSAATGGAWDRVRASRDADTSRLVVRVRGAGAGERLRAELRERCDEDWWRNPRTAAHLAALLAAGRLPPSDPPPAAAAAARSLVASLDGGGS